MVHSWRWQNLKLFILLVLCILILCAGRDLRTGILVHKHHGQIYNRTVAKVLAEYASTVYMSDLNALISWTCSRCSGLTKNFQMIELIVDVEHCLQVSDRSKGICCPKTPRRLPNKLLFGWAFVGVAENLGAIVIAFRGTQENSIRNWVEDLLFKQLDLNYPGMSGSMVHQGFYSAYHNTTLRPRVLEAVEKIQKKNNSLSIMITGHSMGGAMASFCALDLTVNCGAKDVQVVTFGQPRIGNSVFADFYNTFVPKHIRVTHANDIVPHLPPYYTHFPQRTYHHFPREVWIHNINFGSLVYEVERICDGSGEDPTCSRSISGNSITDHLEYYGVSMQAETWGTCGWVVQDDQTGGNDVEVDIDIVSLEMSTSLDALPKANQ